MALTTKQALFVMLCAATCSSAYVYASEQFFKLAPEPDELFFDRENLNAATNHYLNLNTILAQSTSPEIPFQSVLFKNEQAMDNVVNAVQKLEDACHQSNITPKSKHLKTAQHVSHFTLLGATCALSVSSWLCSKKSIRSWLNPKKSLGGLITLLSAGISYGLYRCVIHPWFSKKIQQEEPTLKKTWLQSLKKEIDSLIPYNKSDSTLSEKLPTFFEQRARLHVLLNRKLIQQYDTFAYFRHEVPQKIKPYDAHITKNHYNNNKTLFQQACTQHHDAQREIVKALIKHNKKAQDVTQKFTSLNNQQTTDTDQLPQKEKPKNKMKHNSIKTYFY